MKLEHVALSILDRNEIEGFYMEVLGMELVRSFSLNKVLAKDIFGMEEETEVFLVQKDNLQLELFLAPEKTDHACEHLCFATTHREELFEKAKRNSYRVFRQEREFSDLVFIWDKSGNIFEVKESNQQAY